MLLGILALLGLAGAAGICLGTGAFQSLHWLWAMPVSFAGCFLVAFALAFLFLWVACALVDLKKPQEEDSKFYRAMTTLYLGAVRTILQMRVHTQGMEKLPKDGRYMLVCNHINDMDPLTLLMFFPKSQLAFITKRENMSMFLVGKLMHKLLCQPINRENDREALKTILTCISILKEDKASMAVFPEGYTSMDGLLHHFRPGVFKIAQKTKVPIVVCTLQNTNKIFRNALKLKPTQVHLHLLDVIQPEEYEALTTVALSDRIHTMMAEDLGPDLVLPEE